MNERKINVLANKLIKGTINEEEMQELEDWYNTFDNDEEEVDSYPDQETMGNRIFELIAEQANLYSTKQKKIFTWPQVAVAASILLGISFGGYYILQTRQPQQFSYNKNDIVAGHNQATLTLANGKKIILVKGLTGKLAQQGTTTIKINDGIAYATDRTDLIKEKVVYNTLSTSNGEQSPYPLILADGSKVWLNSESTITFPTAFTGKERIVKITGEAIFEVAHNAQRPFKVQTEKQTIEDIGTTFDVNAYPDEPATKTTLIEGKVKVNGILLEPGQQTDGGHITTVNTKRFSAWKNGDFYFEDDNIQTIMRQLSRWYNIKIIYEDNVTTNGFYAQISRSKNISAILKILEDTKDVHFKIEGRSVIVMK